MVAILWIVVFNSLRYNARASAMLRERLLIRLHITPAVNYIMLPRFLFPLLLLCALLSLGFGLISGSLPLTAHEVWNALLGNGEDTAQQVLWQLRLPRVLAAFACGGLLALSGVLLQALLRNPLADPYILGISGGAAVGRP